jgi:hypothetical protein
MSEQIWFLEDKAIRVSFDTKGYAFYKGGRGILGTPVEAYLRLIAVKGGEKMEIPSVSDLKGRVVIRSPEEALEFVRLFTSIETHYLFPDIPYVEPAVAEHVPCLGEYTEEYKERMNLEPARSRREGNDFVIERNLVDRGGKLFRVTERVGRDGNYSFMKTVLIDEHSPIMYPIYQ